jgi:hypothetical protein
VCGFYYNRRTLWPYRWSLHCIACIECACFCSTLVHEVFAILSSNSYHGMLFYAYLWMIMPYCNAEVVSYLQKPQLLLRRHWVGALQHDLWLIYDRCNDVGGHLPAKNYSLKYSIQYSKHVVQILMTEVMFRSIIRILHDPAISDSPWGATLGHQYAIHVILNQNLITQLFQSTHEL